MSRVKRCVADCEHLRSFRVGFDGKKLLAPYNGKDRLASCALMPELMMNMRGCPVCWREEADGF
jgi:hypothetical protein